MQDPTRGLYICLGRIQFLGEQMDGLHVWATPGLAGGSGAAAKHYQAVCRQAQDGGHLWIPRTVNKNAKTGSVSVNLIATKFLLSSEPIVELEAVLAPALLKHLVCAL